jgi:predicted DNA-binding transcriptional regulator AlpA
MERLRSIEEQAKVSIVTEVLRDSIHPVSPILLIETEAKEEVLLNFLPEERELPNSQSHLQKTPRMLSVEQTFGEPIEIMLNRWYTHEQRTLRDIEASTGVSRKTLSQWLTHVGIQQRTQHENLKLLWQKQPNSFYQFRSNPETEQRRIEAVRLAYKERKDEIAAKIHAGDSDKKRSDSQKRRYVEDPGARQKAREYLQRATEVKNENTQRRMKTVFGNDIAVTLFDLHQNQGLIVADIANNTGYTEDWIHERIKEHTIPYTARTQIRSVRKFQEVHKRLWENPQSFQQLKDKEKAIIYSRFLTDGPIRSLEEVAKELGITRERVRVIEDRAIEKIRSNG